MRTVLLIDDHPIIVSGAESLLRGSEFRAVGRVSDGSDVEALIAEASPDIVVLDVGLPARSGIEILSALRSAGDERPVVFLTAEIDNDDVLSAYRLGLNGLVLKSAAPERLIACLQEVARGGRWIDQTMLQRALTRVLETKSNPDGFGKLSPREREIAELVVKGVRNQEIAAMLGIAPGTVKIHLHRIYEKLGVASRADLVIYARENVRADAGGPRL